MDKLTAEHEKAYDRIKELEAEVKALRADMKTYDKQRAASLEQWGKMDKAISAYKKAIEALLTENKDLNERTISRSDYNHVVQMSNEDSKDMRAMRDELEKRGVKFEQWPNNKMIK